MSGIMAIVSLDGRPVPPELARAQLAAIAHRGEWEPRLWEAPGVALGHVNLPRTPEAEREVLPIPDPAGRYWLTWDGRIDNRDELAPKLGYDVSERASKTDAEYVLDAFIKWGDDCVHHLLGDWAVVIWDNEARRLFCAKDPVGYRQLFYREKDGRVFVGSEPYQLFAGCAAPEPDEDYTRRYLAGVMQEVGRGWLAGMKHLCGGQVFEVTAQTRRTTEFWTQPRITKRPYRRPEEYVDEFVETFDAAIRARLRSNRPIGVYLSGGIDSSYVAAIATKLGTPVTGITAYVPGTTRADERDYASLVARHLSIAQVELDTSDCWTLSSKWLAETAFDGPFQPAQGANQRRLGIAARELGLGVILGGEGGDEWTNGPEAFVANTLAHGHPRKAWRLARLRGGRKYAARRIAREAYWHLVPAGPRQVIQALRGRTGPSTRESRPGWIPFRERMSDVLQWRDVDYHEMEWEIYRDLSWLEPSWRDRHEAAANFLERRPAFFDLRVIELMASTPTWVKRFRGRRKDVLREAEYAVLPDVIPDRTDWGLFDEQFLAGLRAETGRVASATAALNELLGRVPPALEHFKGDGDIGALPLDAWFAISAGVWLSTFRDSPVMPTRRVGAGEPLHVREYASPAGRR